MAEKIEDVIRGGYRTWRKNLVIGAAPVLEIVLIILFFFVVALMAYLSRDSIQEYAVANIDDMNLLLAIAAFLFVSYIIVSLINSFFTAGVVGMAKTALETGKTSLSDMFSYGSRKFLDLFLVGIIITLLEFIGLLLLMLPVIAAFMFDSLNLAIAFSILGVILWFAFMIVLGVVLIPVPYAIVVSGLGVEDGIRRGYGFFMENKLAVVFLFFVTMALGWIIGLIANIVFSVISFILLLMPHPVVALVLVLPCIAGYLLLHAFIITAVITVWWTRLYMDRMGVELEEAPTEPYPKAPEQEPETATQEQFYI